MLRYNPKHDKPKTYCANLDVLPPALLPLTKQRRWVIWKWEPKKGKPTKVPYKAASPNSKASSTNAKTWGSYASARAAFNERDDVDGIGYMLFNGEVAALDLDKCRDPDTNTITRWGQSYVDQAQALGAYVEVTVSGTGLRVIGIGEGAKAHRKFTNIGEGDSSIETYRKCERYITISGLEQGRSKKLPNIDALIDGVVERYDNKPDDTVWNFSDDAPLSDDDITELIERGTLKGDAVVHPGATFHRVVWTLAARGETIEDITEKLRKHPKGIAAKFMRPKNRLAEEVQRSFDKFVANTPAVIDAWNREYAHVLAGGKSAVLHEFKTAEGYVDFKLLSSASFHEWNAEHKYRIGTDADDKPRLMPTSKYWLKHPKRRKYQDIGFFPGRDVQGYYNLWRGFAVEPQKGDCSKFLAHLHDNICQHDDELYDWVIAWFAHIFQRPGTKCGTSLAARGKQGTGKTKLGEVFASLLGVHFKQVAEPRYVTGRFNSHMISLLLLHADEGFWAGDRKAEGKLKDLVTGKTHPIEFKGKEAFWVNNYVRLFVTGNPDWVVPAGFEERRFAVLDAGDEHQKDYSYFAAIDAEMDAGGREALLHHLLFEVDCSQVNLREIPQTTALIEQKLKTATTEQGWWLDILRNGSLPGDNKGKGSAPSALLFDHYIENARKIGASRREIETSLGMFLQKSVPNLRRNKRNYDFSNGHLHFSKRGLVYSFPSLAKCRAYFAAALNQDVQWDEELNWSKWS